MNFYTPQDEQGAPGTIVGWGMNSVSFELQLQEVDLMIMPDKACLTKQWPIYKPSPIYNICAWEQGKGQCNADSGGPLFYDGMQVGIISWSYKPCTMTPYPGVYTRVASYVDWILHKQMLYD
ncbi:CG12951 [Drosophila busckii]|uniref:CG12951 n=1 Tax=Drosophila busckii TaxID=30019 RepID=A0A0M4ER85_DROBS|nr:CG12951 [Drosophila busckii]